jgi:hypothetical protein
MHAPEMHAPEGTAVTPTGSLPPWASTMKGAPVFAEETGPVETRKFRGGEPPAPEQEEEVEIFPKRRAPDSTIGLPEKIAQSPLPFVEPETAAEEGEEAEEAAEPEEEEAAEEEREEAGEEAGEEGEEEGEEQRGRDMGIERVILPADEDEGDEEDEEPAPARPFNFAVFIKAKAFDVLFVGLFWLVALGLAAHSMGMGLFAILGSMSGSMLLLYAVFLLLYYFLFAFFLGETLGDRLFRPRE